MASNLLIPCVDEGAGVVWATPVPATTETKAAKATAEKNAGLGQHAAVRPDSATDGVRGFMNILGGGVL
jgi:hypothetical protein